MKPPDIGALLIPVEASIRQALERIDANAQGIVFVVDSRSKLVGVVTDGDIRRGLLAGGSLEGPLKEVMLQKFVVRPVGTPHKEIVPLLESDGVRHIPLVDGEGRPVDYACLQHMHKFPFLEPSLAGNELTYLTECIKTNWISSQGRFIGLFERQFVDYCQAPYALAVGNGTVALHLALLALGIGEGDEVLVPDLTFAACANTIIHAGATPVLVDVDRTTWTISASAVETAISPRTRAIMPVHLYGHPCDMDPLLALAKKHNLLVLEDCAEALGSTYKGKPVGSMGDAATFSFFGNKTVTTGEGGMILFKDKRHYERAAVLRDHGMSKQRRYWHPEVGYNYRMTNLQAAVGVAQMERVGELVECKRRIASVYRDAFKNCAEIALPCEAEWAKNSYWLYTVLLTDSLVPQRDRIIAQLLLNGIETRPAFYPLHNMPPYAAFQGTRGLEISSKISAAGISLPTSVSLGKKEQKMVCDVFLSLIKTQALYATL